MASKKHKDWRDKRAAPRQRRTTHLARTRGPFLLRAPMSKSITLNFAPAVLGREHAAAYVALSVSSFEQLVRERQIPQPRQLSARRVGWLRAELDDWSARRPASELLPPENTGAPKPR